MSFQFIELEVRGEAGWYRFKRPPKNSVNWDMLYELAAAFQHLLDDGAVRVIVIASALEGHFNTGADLSDLKQMNPEKMAEWVAETHKLARLIRSSNKPVLAAINGIAVGGGLEMCLHADLRYAASDARLGQPEVNIGFIPPVAGTQGLVRLLGRSGAFKVLYGGELIDAASALELGWVDFVVPPEELENEVQTYADMLATKPANALAAIRRCLIEGGSKSFDEGLAIEAAEAISLSGHENFAEGVAAFLEKRKPRWR